LPCLIRSMIIRVLGLFHLVHSPILLIYPWLDFPPIYDLFYILYFYTMICIYTYIQGECPVSYIAKIVLDPSYIAGTNRSHCPEMKWIFSNEKYAVQYFRTTTTLYIGSLGYVIYRCAPPVYILIYPSVVVSIYGLYIHNIVDTPPNIINTPSYSFPFQEFVRFVSVLTMRILWGRIIEKTNETI